MELIYKNESYVIVGARMNVYKKNGCGFLEPAIIQESNTSVFFRGNKNLSMFVSEIFASFSVLRGQR